MASGSQASGCRINPGSTRQTLSARTVHAAKGLEADYVIVLDLGGVDHAECVGY